MPKSVSKLDAVKIINSVDALDIQLEVIDRNETQSSKMTKINRFMAEVNKQVKDERNVILATVKVK